MGINRASNEVAEHALSVTDFHFSFLRTASTNASTSWHVARRRINGCSSLQRSVGWARTDGLNASSVQTHCHDRPKEDPLKSMSAFDGCGLLLWLSPKLMRKQPCACLLRECARLTERGSQQWPAARPAEKGHTTNGFVPVSMARFVYRRVPFSLSIASRRLGGREYRLAALRLLHLLVPTKRFQYCVPMSESDLANPSEDARYALEEVVVQGLSKARFLRRTGYQYYATIQVDEGEVMTLEKVKVKRGVLRWQGPSKTKGFTAKPMSTVYFSLYKAEGSVDTKLGTISSGPVLKFWVEHNGERSFPLKIQSKGRTAPVRVTLVISTEEDLAIDQDGEPGVPERTLANRVAQANIGASGLQTHSKSTQFLSHWVQTGKSAYETIAGASEGWDPLLQDLDVFVKLVNEISEIHPYAKMAWAVLSGVYKLYKRQLDLDEKVKELAEKMQSAYSTLLAHRHLRTLIEEKDSGKMNEALRAINSHKTTLQFLSIRTLDCALVIDQYTEAPDFLSRLATNLLSPLSAKLDSFSKEFEKYNRQLNDESIFGIESMSVEMLEGMEQIIMEHNLEKLEDVCILDARYRSDHQCLEGTRVEILEELKRWNWDINSYDPENSDRTPSVQPDIRSTSDGATRVCILFGEAGTGKSSIANTIADYSLKSKSLGASYRFSAAWGMQSTPIIPGGSAKTESQKRLLPTLAWQLAQSNPLFKAVLCSRLRAGNMNIPQDLSTQFQQLLLEPAKHLPITDAPVYIVIDALDESCDLPARSEFLNVLSDGLAKLPKNFRILLTARPEQDIQKVFGKSQGTLPIWMPRVTQDTNLLLDIQKFIRHMLRYVAEEARLEESDYGKLAEMSQGLFQWALVTCNYIIGDGRGNNGSLRERYEALVDTTENRRTRPKLLDSLYEVVIPRLVKLDTDEMKARFNRVMGLLLHTYEPLTMDAIRVLAGHVAGCTADDVENILPYLGPFLSGVLEGSIPVLPIHSSFRDFLVEHGHCNNIYIGDPTTHHVGLASACLHLIAHDESLHFNMCDLKSSYLLNRDVLGLPQLVQASISNQLSYACRFWALHLSHTGALCSPVVIQSLHVLLEKKFLFWLEALSLLGAVDRAAQSLSSLIPLLPPHHLQVCRLAEDALQFVLHQSLAISDSVPHIYLSALMSAPSDSLIRQVYLPQHPQTAHVYHGQRRQWSPRDRTELAFSVAAARDCKQIVSGIVSGSLDNLTQIGDAEADNTSGVPNEVHTEAVNLTVCSSDGKQFPLCASDRTAGLCGVGADNVVCSVAFSHDWSQVASGSIDKTIWIWDTEGEVVQASKRLVGHTDAVLSVAFSPDGQLLVSGSADRSIQLWDLKTSAPLKGPLVGHTAAVNSVAFSNDGMWIVSGSDDKSIMVWDVLAGCPVRRPLQGHTDSVISVAFSSDDKQIMSRSADKTIVIWDRRTGRRLCERVWGQVNVFMPVTFSPYSKQSISVSADKTFQIWDFYFRQEIDERCRDHSSASTFSVDSTGRRRWCWWWWYLLGGSRDGSSSKEPVVATIRGPTDLFVSLTRDLGQVAPRSGDVASQTWDAAITSRYNAFCYMDAHQPNQPYIAKGGQGAHLSIDRGTGWIKYNNTDCFLWLPPDMLDRACIPPCLKMPRNDEMVFLDLSRFVHGERWTECCQPLAG